ncbi:MAG TPA: hypothetical protein VNX68_14535, partial [Nitrosopumilaceae archaeon]|nr:hypothetical protein [Nitrosopumilaceae archaeon]
FGPGGLVSWIDSGAITFSLSGLGGMIVTLVPTSAVPIDFTTLQPSVLGLPSTQTPQDILNVPLFRDPATTALPATLTSITFQFWLQNVTQTPTDYFSWTWLNDGTMGTVPNPRRSDFTRYGTLPVGWESVYVYAFIFTATAATGQFKFNHEPYFYGGSNALEGDYEWMQVNVSTNSGQFVSKSEMGPATGVKTVTMQNVTITPQNPSGIEPQADQAWIFRRGGQLQQWYRVLVTQSPWTATGQQLSDNDALTLGITFDLNLKSINSVGIPDKIFEIIGPIEGRWYYFTTNFMYPSDINDPDLVNVGLGIRTTGSNSEIFLSAKRINDNSVIVLTSHSAYLLTGTFVTLPDGTVDVYYRNLGCKYPAISHDSTSKEGVIFYLAADGWRSLDANGTNPLLVSPITDRIYRGINCYGYMINTKINPGTTRFPCILALGKLWCGISGQARIEVLDPIRQYWRNFTFGLGDLQAVTSTQDGQILGFFASDKSLRLLDYQAGTTSQTINILSPVFDNGTPTQRHEFYILKIRLQTGAGENLTVKVILDDGTTYTVGTVTSNGSVTQQNIPCSIDEGIPLGKFWQYIFTGTFTNFTLDDIELVFDTRPIQTSHIHLLPDNFGTTGRKRIPTIPFVIDTLGVTVAFIPIVDGATQTPMNISCSRKQSFDYEFTSDVPGIDWEFKLQTELGLFEFFGLNTPQYIEKLPEPEMFHLIPVSNLGSPNKKRVRVWPFILDTLGNDVIFHPVVDGTNPATTTFHGAKQTFFHFFKSDVFGVDYNGYFTGGPFERYEILPPDIVQVLPIARQFDQVGPEELFRYGRLKQIELRCLA